MNTVKPATVSQFDPPHGNLRSYVIGFVSCIVITLLAYAVAVSHSISDKLAIATIAGLAIVQCIIQLLRFLHLGGEFKPRWKLVVFGIMLTIVIIIVAGTLWIMNNLNYRMIETPAQENQYVQSQDGL